ncbi:retrotransposon protein, putative, ty1-copia subclass [Tanacetum coccineum]
MILELADRMISTPTASPRILRESCTVIFLPMFCVVDYVADPRVPLILGRPFLRTARALIDVHGVDGIYNSEGDTVYLEELLSVINSDPNLPPSPVCEINVPEKVKSSCEDPPDLELKDLPSHLTEDKLNYLEHLIPVAHVPAFTGQQVPPEALNLENLGAYDMLQELKTLFSQQAEHELLQIMREFHACKRKKDSKVYKKNKNKKPQLAARGNNRGKGKYKLAYAPKPKIPLHLRRKILLRTQSVTNAMVLAIGSGTGFKALVKQDTLTRPNKLEPRSIKCMFIGYPKETIGYSFYYPPENKVFVARNAEFLKDDLITQEASGSLEDLEIIQEQDTHPSENTSAHHDERNQEINEPQSDIIPIRRSTRTRHAPDRMCLYIDDAEYELGDLNELDNYKAALLDPESNKWLEAMNVEMQSMKNNDVWDLVDLPPDEKTVGSKWLFKKKTNIDGAVHTYKACLVAKGFTQTYRVDYEETFSPVADVRAIMILIAIAAFYDYEI